MMVYIFIITEYNSGIKETLHTNSDNSNSDSDNTNNLMFVLSLSNSTLQSKYNSKKIININLKRLWTAKMKTLRSKVSHLNLLEMAF